jgi:hypothetical protein
MDKKRLVVQKTNDFEPSGQGINAAWTTTAWHSITHHSGQARYETKFKILYSDNGIYCFYYCQDDHAKATITQHNADLWTEDVVEAFFWPDEQWPVYFEYELSPKNFELPILVPNFHGNFHGWLPRGDQPHSKTKHATHVEAKSWTAEFFIPFELLKPLQNCPPTKGTIWRANFYRIDYDHGQSLFAWSPIVQHYHEFDKFGVLVFD